MCSADWRPLDASEVLWSLSMSPINVDYDVLFYMQASDGLFCQDPSLFQNLNLKIG